jgi:hypothetical protein
MYLNDLDKYHNCNEYKLLMQLLEQQLNEDCISRQAASEFLESHAKDFKEPIIRMTLKAGASLLKNPDYVPSVTTPTTKWIPVSERMPKQNEYVGNVDKYYLIQDEFGDMQVAAYTNRGWVPIHTIGAFEYDVVAWQPLPKPYEVGKECEE